MDVHYRMRSNGTDAEIVAFDIGPGPHDVEIRRLPGGGRVAHVFWDGMSDKDEDGNDLGRLLEDFVNVDIPEKVSIKAYGQVDAIIDLDGKPAKIEAPKKIETPGDTEIPNFTQVEDRPPAEPLPAPFENYDELSVKDLEQRISDTDDVVGWAEYEKQNKNRKGVLSALEAKTVNVLADPPEEGDDDLRTTVIEEG